MEEQRRFILNTRSNQGHLCLCKAGIAHLTHEFSQEGGIAIIKTAELCFRKLFLKYFYMT